MAWGSSVLAAVGAAEVRSVATAAVAEGFPRETSGVWKAVAEEGAVALKAVQVVGVPVDQPRCARGQEVPPVPRRRKPELMCSAFWPGP